jgi:hypothetical protein
LKLEITTENGYQSPHTTSGITTMVHKLSVKILDSLRV